MTTEQHQADDSPEALQRMLDDLEALEEIAVDAVAEISRRLVDARSMHKTAARMRYATSLFAFELRKYRGLLEGLAERSPVKLNQGGNHFSAQSEKG
jgi:hypothetical protein